MSGSEHSSTLADFSATSTVDQRKICRLRLSTISLSGFDSGVDPFEDYEIETQGTISGFGGRKQTVCRGRDGQRIVVNEGLIRPSEQVLRALCECEHPCMVSFCEMLSPDISSFLIKERFCGNGWLEGTLLSVFGGERPIYWNPRWITREILGIGFGLSFLHRRGLLHGSLNPSHHHLKKKKTIIWC
jgi:hypothetical protein